VITARDIQIRSRENKAERCTDFEAEVVLRNVARVSEIEIIQSRGMLVEQLNRRLKGQILYKLYGDIADRLRNVMYDVKFRVMDQEEPYLSKMQAIDLIDEVFNGVTNLIDEKMKVD
jgi:hypothetical protein